MKKNYIILVLLMLVAGLQTAQAQYGIRIWKNGSYEQKKTESVDSVTFVKFVESIELSPLTLELQVGETAQLSVTVLPEEATDKTITWQHSANVSVSETGLVTANYKGSGYVKCIAEDGSGAVSANCLVTVTKPDGEDPDEHEYVDLGLPSETLWATCNVGASNPEEYGDHFAWGETSPKSNYGNYNEDWSTYMWYDQTEGTFIKYNETDGLTELLPEDDAATVNWGKNWQMPSEEQFQELVSPDLTILTWTAINDVNGMLITSKSNGRSIFLPAAGWQWRSVNNNGNNGPYWSRTLNEGSNYKFSVSLWVYDCSADVLVGERRHTGFSVRPVRKQ